MARTVGGLMIWWWMWILLDFGWEVTESPILFSSSPALFFTPFKFETSSDKFLSKRYLNFTSRFFWNTESDYMYSLNVKISDLQRQTVDCDVFFGYTATPCRSHSEHVCMEGFGGTLWSGSGRGWSRLRLKILANAYQTRWAIMQEEGPYIAFVFQGS